MLSLSLSRTRQWWSSSSLHGYFFTLFAQFSLAASQDLRPRVKLNRCCNGKQQKRHKQLQTLHHKAPGRPAGMRADWRALAPPRRHPPVKRRRPSPPAAGTASKLTVDQVLQSLQLMDTGCLIHIAWCQRIGICFVVVIHDLAVCLQRLFQILDEVQQSSFVCPFRVRVRAEWR